MEEVSNKTIAVLIAIATVISFAGILSIPRGGVTILGAVTNTTSGTANVSIQSVTQIRLNNATVDFGVGFVNSTDTRCVLESNDSARKNNTGGSTMHPCDNVGGGPGFNAPAVTPNFAVENIGNINVTLRMNSSFHGGAFWGNGTAGTTPGFLCDPRTTNPPQNCTLAAAEYNWSATPIDGVGPSNFACDSDAGGSGTMDSRNRFNDSLNGSLKVVCNNFDFAINQNEIRVALRVGIPRDSKTGLLNDSVLFQADTG